MTPHALWSCSVTGETCCRSSLREACLKLPNLLFFDVTVYVSDLQSELDLLICTTSWFLRNHRNETCLRLCNMCSSLDTFDSGSSKLCGSSLLMTFLCFCFTVPHLWLGPSTSPLFCFLFLWYDHICKASSFLNKSRFTRFRVLSVIKDQPLPTGSHSHYSCLSSLQVT